MYKYINLIIGRWKNVCIYDGKMYVYLNLIIDISIGIVCILIFKKFENLY